MIPAPPLACTGMAAPEAAIAAAQRACRSERLWTALSAQWLGLCRGKDTEARGPS
jgi:hypothetical protein